MCQPQTSCYVRLAMLYQLITGINMSMVVEIVEFNVVFYLNYSNCLLLTICIKQTHSFETNMILN